MRRWRFAPTFARSTRTGGLVVGHTGRLMAMLNLKHSEEGLALGIGNRKDVHRDFFRGQTHSCLHPGTTVARPSDVG